MNQKEVSELRRRFKAEDSAISRIYGCYVNSNKEIISYIDESLGVMPQEEAEKYMSLLKKSISGALGKNLIDIVFSNQQVIDSDEHRMLSSLRNTKLEDGQLRNEFYSKIIESLEMEEGNYLILMAHDAYDVPYRARDGKRMDDASDRVFSYIVCCICPVKDGKPELGYFPGDNEFHNCSAGQIVSQPELGFMFPAFDDRTANIYNALYYTRKPDGIHHEFISAVFNTEPPMTASEQKEAFRTALSDALEDECSIDVAQSVHERLREMISEHKDSKDPEPLVITAKDVGVILQECGVAEEKINDFCEKCTEQFGDAAVMSPENIIDVRRFEVKTTDSTIAVDPERSYLVETRIINGRKYILIPADEGVEVNGLAVGIVDKAEE